MFSKLNWGILILTGLSLIAYVGMVGMQVAYGTLRGPHTPELIAWYTLAFLAYLGAVVWAEKQDISKLWLWGAAVLFRLLLLLTTPSLSDDVYRYLWDGHLATQGTSPYALAIDDPALDSLEVPIRDLANNTWMASPYLPAAQFVFFGVAAVFPLKPIFLQIAMIIFDLFSAWILAQLLSLTLLPSRRLLLYLWNPLVVVEVAHGAHIDSWMLLLALLAVYLSLKDFRRGRLDGRYLAPIFLALATLTKLLPALLFPILFWFWNWRQRTIYILLTIALLIPFGLNDGWGLTGELNGRGVFGALRIYSRQWNFNSGIFHWLENAWAGSGMANPTETGKFTIIAFLALFLLSIWLMARKRGTPISALRLMSLPFMGYTLLTPTMHPWYILILLAFLPFLTPLPAEGSWRWLLIAPWIYLSGALIFSYLTYLDPLNFGELEWVRRLEWLPTLSLLVLAIVVTVYQKKIRHSAAIISS